MAVEIKCDECGTDLDVEKDIVCYICFAQIKTDLEDKITELEEELDAARAERDELQEKLDAPILRFARGECDETEE